MSDKTETRNMALFCDFENVALGVRDAVGEVLDEYLPEVSYDKELFVNKRDKYFELTLDLAINHMKWAA